MNNFLKTALSVLVLILIFLLGAVSMWFFQTHLTNQKQTTQTKNTPTSTPEQSTSPTQQADNVTTTPTNTPIPTKSDKEQIAELFATKFNRPVSEIEVIINKQRDPYMQGGVKEKDAMGGGWFLAYKKDGKWIIVDDGNGTISCEKIEPYNFPTDMVPECVDSSGHLKTR